MNTLHMVGLIYGVSTSSITYWKITWKYDTLETKTFGLVSTIRDVFPAAAAT